MAVLTLEGSRLATRSDFVSAPIYSNVTDVVDFTTVGSEIYCTHQSGRISYGDGISQTYIENANGFATFPFLTNNISFIYAGYWQDLGGSLYRYFAAPASGGMMFIRLQYVNEVFVGSSYVIDPTFPISSYQGLRGVTTATSNDTGSGEWEDLVCMSSSGTFAVLNQSTKATTSTPYFVDSMTGIISNNWVVPTVTSGGKFDSVGNDVFVFPLNSPAPGSSIGFPQWPSLRPVVAGTRNFTQFTYKANPFAFEMDGTTPLANWDSFAATSIATYGSLTMVSGPNYVYSLSVG